MPQAPFSKLLIANRGEIAIRIARAAADLGIASVAVYSEDDAASLHIRKADEAHALGRAGVSAYLDGARIVALATTTGCDAVHPGYGFLAENADFARAVAAAGLTFVGPSPEALALFGDKLKARDLARRIGVPVIEGEVVRDAAEAREFFDALGAPIMLKAVAGGGGRGMRAVRRAEDIAEAFARCRSEAKTAFGDGALYAERLIESARHIEIQILGDRHGGLTHFGERECTIQRRNQKLIEIAPSPSLTPGSRERIIDAAMRIARTASYDSLGTFEFLLDAKSGADDAWFAFIEANPRLQVEHTVTEEVFGVDLVQAQIRIAAGESLANAGVEAARAPRGYAIQARVNLETMTSSGEAHTERRPDRGVRHSLWSRRARRYVRLRRLSHGGGLRFPHRQGHRAFPAGDFALAAAKASRALGEFRIGGVETNISFLQAVLPHPDFTANRIDTRFIETHLPELLKAAAKGHRRLYFDADERSEDARPRKPARPRKAPSLSAPHLQGTIVSVDVVEGERIRSGQQIAVIEAMKMEHLVVTRSGGIVREVRARKGDTLYKDDPIVFIELAETGAKRGGGGWRGRS